MCKSTKFRAFAEAVKAFFRKICEKCKPIVADYGKDMFSFITTAIVVTVAFGWIHPLYVCLVLSWLVACVEIPFRKFNGGARYIVFLLSKIVGITLGFLFIWLIVLSSR